MSSVAKNSIKRQSLDIITSALNEEECLPELFTRLSKVMSSEPNYDYRIIVMDNGSHDSSWKVIEEHSQQNQNVVGIQLSRTFSLDAAFTCGLDHAKADIAILMTSDLQDPPELIPNLLRAYEEGYDQVLVRITRRDSVPAARRVLSWLFYFVASRMTNGMLPKSVSDFRLMTRKTYKSIGRLRESHRFMRGIGSWVGFDTAYIEMERPARFAGTSKWLGISLTKVFGQATKSIFAYSSQPLMWLSAAGLISSFLTMLFLFALIIYWISGGARPFEGFGTLVALGSVGFSAIMLSIGVLAQYLSLTYEEVKQRPLYLVSKSTKPL